MAGMSAPPSIRVCLCILALFPYDIIDFLKPWCGPVLPSWTSLHPASGTQTLSAFLVFIWLQLINGFSLLNSFQDFLETLACYHVSFPS